MAAPAKPDDGTYLDLTVGPYNLALTARAVLAVLQDVELGRSLQWGGTRVPALDLGASFRKLARERVPFVVTFEADGSTAAIGVDNVGHLRSQHAKTISSIPTLGLSDPNLIEGGLREGDRLLLVLRPAALLKLAASADDS